MINAGVYNSNVKVQHPRLQKHRRKAPYRAILDAALALLFEDGYTKLTVERLAERAGVSRQTIYRWWPSLGAVVLEAYGEEAARRVPEPDTGSLAGDLRQLLGDISKLWRAHGDAPRAMIAESQRDPRFMELWREFNQRRREVLLRILKRAEERGELALGSDAEFLTDLIYGPLWYRLLLGHAPLDEDFTERIVAIMGRLVEEKNSSSRP